MKIYIGADHNGFELKKYLLENLSEYTVIDMGAFTHQPQDDFVDFATPVAGKVISDSDARGILICGSGAGMCIAANKIAGIRCSVGHLKDEVKASRNDDDINVLALSSNFISKEEAKEVVETFLTTPFAGDDRFIRRIAKITELENHA